MSFDDKKIAATLAKVEEHRPPR